MEAVSGEFELLLKNYFIVGGMPEAVGDWVETGSLVEVRKTQLRILSDYDDDFKKHAPLELLPRIRLVWNGIPVQFAKENEKFQYASLKPGARSREYDVALEWLKDAGMLYRLYNVPHPALPIAHHMRPGDFKVFAHDIGLLCAMSGLDPTVVLERNDLFAHFKGAVTEQYVLQELKALGLRAGYWAAKGGTAEVDFVVQGRTAVYPIEVKAATNTKAKSLGVYMEAFRPRFAVKTSLKNYSVARDVRSLPLYALPRWIGKWLED